MTRQKMLEALKIAIKDNNINKIQEIVENNINTFISNKEITTFLENSRNVPSNKYSQYYCITGSGGSKLKKPNITSIAFLYIASMGIPIVKTGSRAMTGTYGSTDLFEELNLCNREIDNKKYKFAYFDVFDTIRWLKYKKELSKNECFNKYFCNTEIHEFKVKSKMTIQIDERKYEDFLNLKNINKPNELFVIYSSYKNKVIDEIMPGKITINNDVFFSFEENYEFYEVENIKKIDYDLIKGKKVNDFWYETLKLTIAIFLLVNNFTTSIKDGCKLFEEKYKNKSVIKMLKDIYISI